MFFDKNIDKMFDSSEKVPTFASLLKRSTTKQHRGVEQLVARQAHNLEVARSSRTPATK